MTKGRVQNAFSKGLFKRQEKKMDVAWILTAFKNQ